MFIKQIVKHANGYVLFLFRDNITIYVPLISTRGHVRVFAFRGNYFQTAGTTLM